MEYIRGNNLRHNLAELEVGLHDLDVTAGQELRSLQSARRVDHERKLFSATLGAKCKPLIGDLVRAMNQRGVAVLDAKLGNVLRGENSQTLYWVDFERAHIRSFPGWKKGLSEQFGALNQSLDLGFITPEKIRAFASRNDLYSPVDFGEFGYAGNIADIEVGEGRWWWLLRRLTSWAGKRVLDLGANNCIYAIRAIQAGAADFHCVERDAQACDQARFVKSSFEQLECRSFNMTLHHADIVSFLTSRQFEADEFDITMALCSIYYLSASDIARCLRIIARGSKECWLQGNVWTSRESREVREHAQPDFLADQLRRAGFTNVAVIAPKGYHRPLVIGKKAD